MVALTGITLYTMLIILGVMALDILAGIYRSVVTNTFSFEQLAKFLKTGILHYVIPLFALLTLAANLTMLQWLLQGMFYVGAIGVGIKYIMDIIKKLNS